MKDHFYINIEMIFYIMFNVMETFICSLISFLLVLVILGVITFVVLKLLERSCNRYLKTYISYMYGDDCSD